MLGTSALCVQIQVSIYVCQYVEGMCVCVYVNNTMLYLGVGDPYFYTSCRCAYRCRTVSVGRVFIYLL